MADAVLLAVEVVSPTSIERDRKAKKWAYAHGGIPRYLLIDAYDDEGPIVSLFTEPVEGVYTRTVRAAFGHSIRLNEPIGIELATDGFLGS